MARRKLRPREHVIADLGENWVERVALKAGFDVRRVAPNDYGIDLHVTPVSEDGEIEAGLIFCQVKATERFEEMLVDGGRQASINVYSRDVALWQKERYPVILALYDAHREVAYWSCVQRDVPRVHPTEPQLTRAVRIPVANELRTDSFRLFARWLRSDWR